MFKSKKFVVGGIIIICAMGTLLFLGLRDTTPHYENVSDLLAEGSAVYGQRVKLDGRVVDGSIVEDTANRHYEFLVGGFKSEDEGELSVVYQGTMPDGFKAGADLMITGEINADGLIASKILTVCASKYGPEALDPEKLMNLGLTVSKQVLPS